MSSVKFDEKGFRIEDEVNWFWPDEDIETMILLMENDMKCFKEN